MDNKTKEVWDKAIAELHRIANSLSSRPVQSHSAVDESQHRGDDHPTGTHRTTDPRSRPEQRSAANSKWRRPFKWWKERLETAAFIAAIIYAGITFQQWRDLRHNFEVDERAWAKAEVEFPPDLVPEMRINVTARNVGKSPALELFGGFVVEVVDANNEPLNPSGGTLRQFESRMIFPNGLVTSRSGPTPNNPDGSIRPLTQDEIQRLAQGKAYLAVFGTIIYKDQFGSHWTRFCVPKGYQTVEADYRVQSCERFNTIGDGDVHWAGPGNL